MDIFTRLIWTATSQHTAVNYPITAYGAFTPNMPTKLYDDDRVAPEVFNAYRLPNGFVSAVSKGINIQWNPEITMYRGSCKIESLHRGFVLRYWRKTVTIIVISGYGNKLRGDYS